MNKFIACKSFIDSWFRGIILTGSKRRLPRSNFFMLLVWLLTGVGFPIFSSHIPNWIGSAKVIYRVYSSWIFSKVFMLTKIFEIIIYLFCNLNKDINEVLIELILRFVRFIFLTLIPNPFTLISIIIYLNCIKVYEYHGTMNLYWAIQLLSKEALSSQL